MSKQEECNVKLSVIVPTYNHEKYIAQALNSIIMQKVNFEYEVLVGEDCSTDNTKAVIQQFEEEHPGKLTVFYRKENMNNKEIRNARDLTMRAKGKYIIILEGDDYWTDENKLQKQVDFLDAHPDYIAVAHNCEIVNASGEKTKEKYPECKVNDYAMKFFLRRIYPGQTTTIMHHNFYHNDKMNTSIISKGLMPGDYLKIFIFLSYGKVYCMQESMSAYRHVTDSGNSYSANYNYDYIDRCHYYYELMNYAHEVKKYEAEAEAIYFNVVWSAFFNKKISYQNMKERLQGVLYWNKVLYLFFTFVIRKYRRKIIKKLHLKV